jgi:hypothetical protein
VGGGGKGGKASVSSNVNVKSDNNATIDIIGLDDIDLDLSTDLKLPQPLKTDSRFDIDLPQPFSADLKTRSELAVTEPVVAQIGADVAVDIKPVVVDLCLQLGMTKLPPTCVRMPYQHHFGFTLFGMEVLGFNFSGEPRLIIEDVPRRPQVVWAEESGPPRRRGRAVVHEPGDEGLAIRVGG